MIKSIKKFKLWSLQSKERKETGTPHPKKKYDLIIFLIIFSLFTKSILIIPNNIPFSFDHGKDSIAILHMVKTFSPKLIGPWTSIPGLFFGPAWYYLLGPVYFLTNGNPVSAVFTMIALNLVTIYLAYKHFGKLEAVVFATADAFIILSTSAWNPFPAPLLMLIILIILKKKKLAFKDFFSVALMASLAFHFSSAYAFFYLIALPILIIYRAIKNNNKITFKKIIVAGLGFLIPFLPQIVFELRNKFIETNAVINYLRNPPANQPKTPIKEVFLSTLNEMKIAVLPQFGFTELATLNKVIALIFITALILGLTLFIKRKKKIKLIPELIVFILIPIFGLSKLHFNIWYLYSMFPVFIIFFAQFIKEIPKKAILLLVIFYLLNPIEKIISHFDHEQSYLAKHRAFLPIKVKALKKIEELSKNKSYSSYHYVPDIYDYSYQYLYFQKAFKGKKLPYEFSYQPGETTYIKEKTELLEKVESFEKKPEYIFYIVEKAENQDFLDSWWNHQSYNKIIYSEKLSETVTLYQATHKEE